MVITEMANQVLLLVGLCLFAPAVAVDWLVKEVTVPTTCTKTHEGTLLLTNGLISREFTVYPDFATIDYYSHEKEASILRALNPEAVIALDYVTYNVGGLVSGIPRGYLNRTALSEDIQLDESSFHFVSYRVSKPTAPFPYSPRRGAPKDIVWPPKGIRLEVDFSAPFWAPIYHKDVVVTVYYDMYDGIPLLSKWVGIKGSTEISREVLVDAYSVEFLAVNQQWSGMSPYFGWMFVETNEPHGTQVEWVIDPQSGKMPGAFEPLLNCSYKNSPTVTIGLNGFESFHVHELVHGTRDPERIGLAKHRMVRLLAPHTQENPIFFHMTKIDPASVYSTLDQLAEVGFEMMIFSFGTGFNIETVNETFIDLTAQYVHYANKKGIEIGSYDLIALTRNPGKEFAAVAVNGRTQNNACFASGWYDYLLDKFLTFMKKTGLSMVETDGPYGGYSCYSTNHSHHKDWRDSVYMQNKLQGDFYHILRQKAVYINQPDTYFYQGGSRTGIGYNENQYSLPRWQDLSISRQSVFDDTFHYTPTQGWMFLPLVDYHGGGAAAAFEPLSEHLVEYEWGLAQYLGAGVAACYRGYRIFDGVQTKALVKKWVDFYKKYRDIVTSDIVHVRRPDMQSIDSFMHVNPKLKNKALVMVFNPTRETQAMNLTVPLYYTGLEMTAMISEEGGLSRMYELDRDYSVDIYVKLPPLGITWYIVQ